MTADRFEPDYSRASVRPSANFGERIGVAGPDMVVLHYTGMETGQGAEDWLCDPRSEVSSHYLVHEDGRVLQMVRERDRAWHAGKSSWHGETDINSRSVGIEIVNPGHTFGYVDFPQRQVDAVIDLCGDIVKRCGIAAHRVLGHSDIAPGRKVDPGERFPWALLASHGLGVWAAPAPLAGGQILVKGQHGRTVKSLQQALVDIGYGLDVTGEYDERTEIVVAAFQRHFRPGRIDGRADRSTMKTLKSLQKAR